MAVLAVLAVLALHTAPSAGFRLRANCPTLELAKLPSVQDACLLVATRDKTWVARQAANQEAVAYQTGGNEGFSLSNPKVSFWLDRRGIFGGPEATLLPGS